MTVWGITRSRDEVDIIESSIRRMLAQVDHVLIGDNSTDGTEAVLARLAVEFEGRLTVKWDAAPSVAQRDVMTTYARMARDEGASWVVPFDIDEVWQADRHTIRERLAQIPDCVLLVPARLVEHRCSTLDDLSDPDPFSRQAWRPAEMLPLMKVACRARGDLRIGHGNHEAHYRKERFAPAVLGVLSARHFPYRSVEQFIKRVLIAWPQLRDSGLPESHGAHVWKVGRVLERDGEDGLREFFRETLVIDDPAAHGYVRDPVARVNLPLSVPA